MTCVSEKIGIAVRIVGVFPRESCNDTYNRGRPVQCGLVGVEGATLLLYNSELDVGETVESCLAEVPVESESVCYLQPAHEFETCAVCEAPSSTAASCEGLDGFME